MQFSYTIRRAAPSDAPAIAAHRRGMFRDMGTTEYLETPGIDEAFIAWVTPKMQQGEFFSWLAVDSQGTIVGGASLWIRESTPQAGTLDTRRGYILNVYVEPEHRRRGLARRLMLAVLDGCRDNGLHSVGLHASEYGRTLYEALGFETYPQPEMFISLR